MRYLLTRGHVMSRTRLCKKAYRIPSNFFFHQHFATGFTSIHSEKTSSEYAKLRKESLENKFGSILGTQSSKTLLTYYRFGPFLALYRAAIISFHVVKLSIWHFFVQDIHKRAIKFRETLIHLGPFYIKLGQALSTRPDILPSAYCTELSKLQDQIPPFPTHIAIKSIESQVGLPISEIFADISPKPIAAASLGQVYKAHLNSGELVAVKVQRPGMSLSLTLDALLFNMIGGQLKRFAKARKDLLVAVNEMVRHMFDEIDYILEAQNAERFAILYACCPSGHQNSQKMKSAIKVPKIYWSSTRKEVLTMEWINGIKLTDTDRINEASLDKKKLIDQGLHCSLRQLLEEGFFHGDPHPGNLVATHDGSLAYFDFGMMGEIPRHFRVGLIQVLVHFINRDSFGLANDFLSLGFIPDGANLSSVADALQASFGDGSRHSSDFQVAAISEQASESVYNEMSVSSVPSWKSFDMRAVVAATEDLLHFILSEKGRRVRVFLVQDIVKASDAFLHEQAYPYIFNEPTGRVDIEGDTMTGRVVNGLRSLQQAVKLAPEVWSAMLIRMLIKPEVHVFAFDIVTALARHSCRKIPSTFWLCISRLLHNLQEHDTLQDS